MAAGLVSCRGEEQLEQLEQLDHLRGEAKPGQVASPHYYGITSSL